ncbi:MAG: hypothetical protein LUB59_05370 [Candidatus Gastranaerophilales bacterium]|nr:hypothetical protein [Candidatus Gastranaerophilales bacterium]
MVVSYTNNYGYTDAYANKGVNTLSTNADGGGNGGGGAFMKMFEEQESEEAKKEEVQQEENNQPDPLDNLYNLQQNYYASPNVIRDYVDNSLLLNTEQVACTNITQHIALKSNVRETLKFLNLQAAKSMVSSKKRNYNFHTVPQPQPVKNSSSSEANFFETKVTPTKNFFIT